MRLKALEVTNSMPAQAEVYGQRAAPELPEMAYPNISYNAPPLMRFSGKSAKYQTITDFMEAILRQAMLECRNEELARVNLSLNLFHSNLKGDARSYLNMLTPAEKEDWAKPKEVYIYKFKTERDLRAKKQAKEQCASFKQWPDESLKAYGEHTMKLCQLIDSTEEGFLVYRFLKGIQNKSVRQILSLGPDDMSKVTVVQMNTRIASLVGAGKKSDASKAESDDSSNVSSGGSDTDSSYRRQKGKRGEKTSDGNDLEKAMNAIRKLEAKVKGMQSKGPTDTFVAQAVYNNNTSNYKRSAGQADGTPRANVNDQQGGGQRADPPDTYLCYNCGNPAHLY